MPSGTEELTALADRGYFKGEEILACEQAGITAIRAQAADLQQQGRGALRQAGLRLRRQTTTSTAARPGKRLIYRFTRPSRTA